MNTKELTLIGVMVAFIVASAQISIPLGPVPFTLQTMVILTSGLVLGSKKGFISVLIYILLGAVGLPVFANFNGGVGAIFAQTGGFIMSFPIMAFVAGKVTEITSNKLMRYVGCIVGVLINFTVGCGYFMFITKMDLKTSLSYTVLPFMFTTAVQIIFAVKLSEKLKEILSVELGMIKAK